MSTATTLARLLSDKIVAIIRGVGPNSIVETAIALAEGGISCLEVTVDHTDPMTVEATMKSIRRLTDLGSHDLAIGVGTVLKRDEVSRAADAGATYVISPNVDEAVIASARKSGLVSIPGAFTPTEVVVARDSGADIVKLFPAGLLGPEYVKAIRGPLFTVPLMAVGGISPGNLLAFLSAGACGVGVGGNLVNLEAIASGDFGAITKRARAYRSALEKAPS